MASLHAHTHTDATSCWRRGGDVGGGREARKGDFWQRSRACHCCCCCCNRHAVTLLWAHASDTQTHHVCACAPVSGIWSENTRLHLEISRCARMSNTRARIARLSVWFLCVHVCVFVCDVRAVATYLFSYNHLGRSKVVKTTVMIKWLYDNLLQLNIMTTWMTGGREGRIRLFWPLLWIG